MRKYTNLADGVHYNQTASYLPPDMTNFNGYANKRAHQLKREFEEALRSDSDDLLGFTLNQITDNLIFFQSSTISEELFSLLIALMKNGKAFISTYDGHSVSSYAQKCMISSWKRICDDQTDDLRYVSSLIEALAHIKGDPDPDNEAIIHYSDHAKREAHKAIFGIDRLVTISDGMVQYDTYRVPIDRYLQDTTNLSQDQNKYGYYTGLYFHMKDEYCINTHNYLDRMQLLIKNAKYAPNAPFVRENQITLTTVMELIIRSDILEQIFIETIDSALEKKIRKVKSEFLDASRTAFLCLANPENTTRSKMYEKAFTMIETYLKPVMGYSDNNFYKNAKYRLAMSFFFQVIDFCYNYFNFLQVYGVADGVNFVYYPYYTQNGKASDESANIDRIRKGSITLTNSLFQNKILYTIHDSNHNPVGSYIKYEYAKNAFTELKKKGQTYYLVDNQGSIISD